MYQVFHSHCYFIFQPNASKKDCDGFLSEAAILGQFNDANVISIEGVIVKGIQNTMLLFCQVFYKIYSLYCNFMGINFALLMSEEDSF